MTWEAALRLLGAQEAAWRGPHPGLERMRRLLGLLGDPQEGMRFVHIAGTNGKGSAAAMLSEILRAAGYRTGRYISPHLVRVNERFAVDGEDISDACFAALAERVRRAAEWIDDKPTIFELFTAVSFLFFREESCDIAVLEVGLGGRFDATNVIPAPEAALIMDISLEHTELLGNTVRSIAFEKAGIVKPGGAVVLSAQSREAMEVVEDACRQRGACLVETRPELLAVEGAVPSPREKDLPMAQRFSYRGRRDLELALLGAYQARNAAVVLDAVDLLRESRGLAIPEEAIRSGLARVRWPGRFQVMEEARVRAFLLADPPEGQGGGDRSHAPSELHFVPRLIVDGAHNPGGCRVLAENIRSYLSGRNLVLLMGVMADKDLPGMLGPVAGAVLDREERIALHRVYAVAPQGTRALAPEALRERMGAFFPCEIQGAGSVGQGLREALRWAAERGCDILAFGSLYQVGEILGML